MNETTAGTLTWVGKENVIWTLIEIGKWMEPTAMITLLTWIEIISQGNGVGKKIFLSFL